MYFFRGTFRCFDNQQKKKVYSNFHFLNICGLCIAFIFIYFYTFLYLLYISIYFVPEIFPHAFLFCRNRSHVHYIGHKCHCKNHNKYDHVLVISYRQQYDDRDHQNCIDDQNEDHSGFKFPVISLQFSQHFRHIVICDFFDLIIFHPLPCQNFVDTDSVNVSEQDHKFDRRHIISILCQVIDNIFLIFFFLSIISALIPSCFC